MRSRGKLVVRSRVDTWARRVRFGSIDLGKIYADPLGDENFAAEGPLVNATRSLRIERVFKRTQRACFLIVSAEW